MFRKKNAFLGWLAALLITLLFIFSWQGLKFNYDFENFFSQNDPDLDFYIELRKTFENDNDYLLISLGNSSGIFERDFLDKSLKIENRIKSLNNVESVFSLLSIKEPIIGSFGVSNRPVLDWSDEATLEKSSQRLMQDPNWRGNLVDEDGENLLLLMKNKQLIGKEEGDTLYHQVKEVLEESGIEDYKVAGKIKAQGEFVSLLQEEFSFFFLISGMLITLMLYLLFRSWWGVILPLIILMVGIFWTIAFLLLTGGELDVMLVMQPPILLVIGLSGMIHFINHYLTLLREGHSKDNAILYTFKELGLAVFLTALTTSLGFMSLYFTYVSSLSWFGVYTGVGVLMMFLAVILIMPMALYLLPPLKLERLKVFGNFWSGLLLYLFSWVLKHRTHISLAFILLSIVAGFFISRIKTDGYILDNLPADHPLVQEFEFFDENFGGSKPLEIYVEIGENAENLLGYQVLKEMDKLEAFIKNNFETGFILSPLSLVKGINKAQNRGNPKAFNTPTEGQLDRMGPYLEQLIEKENQNLISEDLTFGRFSTRMADVGSYKGGMQHEAFKSFVDNEIDEKLLKARMTGTSFLIDRSHKNVTRQVFNGLGVAFLLVGLIVGILFRSWRVALTVLVPNIVPLLWVGGVMYLAGMDFKLSTSIIFAIAFGIAVDDSIHFMTRFRIALGEEGNFFHALKRTFFTTGKAIVLTTLILSSGFLVLVFSQFEIAWFTGLLVSLALVFALLADLLWLPLLLIPLKTVLEKKVTETHHFPK